LLRGAGGAAVALPLLDAMQPIGRARAATSPQRFIVYYTPGGTDMAGWRPTGNETSFTLGPSLQPLERLKSNLLVLNGVDMKVTSEGTGHPHARGMGGLLTGEILPPGPYNTCGGNAGFALGRSIDQVLGDTLGADRKFKTIEMAIRWPSVSLFAGTVHPGDTIIYAAPSKPVPPAVNPRAIYDRLFKDLAGDTGVERKRSLSIVSAVMEEYRQLSMKLGAGDRRTLDAHLAGLREMETGLTQLGATGTTCTAPNLGPDLDAPYAGATLKGGDGYIDLSNDEPMPRTGKLMMDMMVAALACDLVRVGTIQWADSSANNTFPWLMLKDTHHGYQHDRGYQPDAIRKITSWYAGQFAYFLDKMIATQENGQPLLDSTLIFACTEISVPNTHGQNDMPFMLAGRAGGRVRPGRWLQMGGRSSNDLLVTIQNVFGIAGNTYGRAKFCTGPLPGIA
jgi:hypothetical protein